MRWQAELDLVHDFSLITFTNAPSKFLITLQSQQEQKILMYLYLHLHENV